MLDISRSKVPTLATLRDLAGRLASWKINQLQLYMEHTFPYTGHEDVWRDASPISPDEILSLDAYCRERHIELVPTRTPSATSSAGCATGAISPSPRTRAAGAPTRASRWSR